MSMSKALMNAREDIVQRIVREVTRLSSAPTCEARRVAVRGGTATLPATSRDVLPTDDESAHSNIYVILEDEELVDLADEGLIDE